VHNHNKYYGTQVQEEFNTISKKHKERNNLSNVTRRNLNIFLKTTKINDMQSKYSEELEELLLKCNPSNLVMTFPVFCKFKGEV
jgi:hypothetical protein